MSTPRQRAGLGVRPRRVVTALCMSSFETGCGAAAAITVSWQPLEIAHFLYQQMVGLDSHLTAPREMPMSGASPVALGLPAPTAAPLLSLSLLWLWRRSGRRGECCCRLQGCRGLGLPERRPRPHCLTASHRRSSIFKGPVTDLPPQTPASAHSRWPQSPGAEGWGSGSSRLRVLGSPQPRHWVPE